MSFSYLLIKLNFAKVGSKIGEVVVARLVEQSLPIPDVRSSNPVIGKNVFILNICFLSTVNF